ncbi:MAG: hypothetical protein RSD49_16355 [Hafnia sp.]
MCTSDTIYRLEMSPSADGEYWGWLVDGSVSLIQSSMVTFEMCFPGGLAAAEATGRGVRIQLDVSSWLPEGCW